MHSTIIGAITLALIWATCAAAQSEDWTPYIVDDATRGKWCFQQLVSCRWLCLRNEKSNSCNPPTLRYECLCSNSSAPGLQYYIETIPTYYCEAVWERCLVIATTDASKAECRAQKAAKCGTLDPEVYLSQATDSSIRTPTATLPTSSILSTNLATVTSADANKIVPLREGEGVLGPSTKIAVGVTIPLVFIIAISALLWFLRRKRKAKNHLSMHDGAELHGDSRAHELPGHTATPIHEIEAVEHEKRSFIPPLVVDMSNEGQIHELSEQGFGATQSGPLNDSHEMPIGSRGAMKKAQGNQLLGKSEPVEELSEAPIATSKERADMLQTTPIETTQASTMTPRVIDEEETERERQALEQRRSRITAERERLRRMQELDEEESGIEHRLGTLGRSNDG